MEHVVKIEITLSGESARLYEILGDTVGPSVKPGQINRAVLETGLVHHLLMLVAVGVISGDERTAAEEAISSISERTIMKDLFESARRYWENQSDSGLVTPDDQIVG